MFFGAAGHAPRQITKLRRWRALSRTARLAWSTLPSKALSSISMQVFALVADVGQRRYVAAPAHSRASGQLGAHVVQRIGHGAHLAQLLGEELDILVMDMENLVLKFVDGWI